MVDTPLFRRVLPQPRLEVPADLCFVRLQRAIGQDDPAVVIYQGDPIHHGVEGSPPVFAHPPQALGQIVNRHQIPGALVVAGAGYPELDLGDSLGIDPPVGLDDLFVTACEAMERGFELARIRAIQKSRESPPHGPYGPAVQERLRRRVGFADLEIAVEPNQRRRRGREQLAKTVLAGHQGTTLIRQTPGHVPERGREIADLGRGAGIIWRIDNPFRIKCCRPLGELVQRPDDPSDQRQPDHQRERQRQTEPREQAHGGRREVGANARLRNQKNNVDDLRLAFGRVVNFDPVLDPQQPRIEAVEFRKREPVPPQHAAVGAANLAGPDIARR